MADDDVAMYFIERDALVFVSVDSLHKWLELSIKKLTHTPIPAEQREHYIEAIKLIQMNVLQAMFEARGERTT